MRILFLTHRLPYAPNRGDRIRAYHLLRQLSSFAEVDLVSFAHSSEEASHASALEELAGQVRVIRIPRIRNWISGGLCMPTSVPLTHRLLDAPSMRAVLGEVVSRRPDVIVPFCSGMARFATEPPLAGIPFVIDMVDVDSQKWADLAEATSGPRRWLYRREARCLAQFERSVSRRASATLVINEREHLLLRQLAPDANIATLPSGVDVEAFRTQEPPSPSLEVVFCGVMNYQPNEIGAVWLAEEVWPLVRQAFPDAVLTLVGATPTPRVEALAAESRGISVTGSVADVRPYLWRSAVATAPLHTARGLQNKVLEAIAAGLPTVVTPAVAAGLPAVVAPACVVADTAAEFAAGVRSLLLNSPGERRAIAARANLTELSWSTRLAPLRAIIEGAADEANQGVR